MILKYVVGIAPTKISFSSFLLPPPFFLFYVTLFKGEVFSMEVGRLGGTTMIISLNWSFQHYLLSAGRERADSYVSKIASGPGT